MVLFIINYITVTNIIIIYLYINIGCVCLFSNSESFEYIRNSLEKTLLYNLEKDDKLPFQGLPIILLYINEFGMGPNKSLQEDGQSLAHRYDI